MALFLLHRPACRAVEWINHNGLHRHSGPRVPEAKWEITSISGLLAVTPQEGGRPSSFRLPKGSSGERQRYSQTLDLETMNTWSKKLLFLFACKKSSVIFYICYWKEAILLEANQLLGILICLYDLIQGFRNQRRRELCVESASCLDV